MEVEQTRVLGTWEKFGPGASLPYQQVEVHLRERVIDGQAFVELRDFFPEAMEYGRGYLLRYGGRRVGRPGETAAALREVLGQLASQL
ncbi:MAG: hypothetical protein KDB83_09280 [Actinobacteria bacterium]|nr:hypothetical protein [Actinomycetota bacterium]